MDQVMQDLKLAVRRIINNPGFTMLAVITLALGIGANTAIFSLLNGALLRPLPGVQEADRLVTLERTQNGKVQYSFGYPDYLDYRDRSDTLSGLAAHCGTPLSFASGSSERLRGDLVSGNYFSILGVQPAFGKLISQDDNNTPGGHFVAVLSYRFWMRAFGADPDAVGRVIRLNGYEFTIIGIAARDFTGTQTGASYDVWIPLMMQAQAMPRTLGRTWFKDRTAGWLGLFGRLKPGASVEQAQSELGTIASSLEQAYPDTNSGRGASVFAGLGFNSDDRSSLRNFLGLLLAAVALLLLIACTNVASLFLLRATARRREIAVKLALGATRGRIVRQLLTEGLVIAVMAGASGSLFAPWTTQMIAKFQQPAYALRGVDVSLDARVFFFTALLSLLTALAFSLIPALQASKADLVTALKDGTPGSGSGRSLMQSSLVIAQVALSIVLLIGAGLALRTMQKALSMERGFEGENMALMSMDLTIRGYSESQGRAFYEDLLNRVNAIPGVISSSLAKTVPPNDWSDRLSVFLPGDEPPPEVLRARDDLGLRVDANRIAPDYFRTLGIPILEGREFNTQDRTGSPLVAIVNEKLARQLWPGDSAIGKLLAVPFWHEPRPPVQIIGVVRNTKHRSLLEAPPLLVYLPELQVYDGRATLVARTSVDPATLLPAIRDEVATIDKDVSLYSIKTMSEQIASTLWQQRMAAGLIGVFGLLALALAAIGIYGVVSHWVAARTREIGIRMALGADARAVMRMILGQGFVLALIGVAVGLVGAFALTRLMSSLLYGVSSTDPTTFLLSAVVLIGVALGAAFVPARRATKVDPMIALRCE